MKEGFGRRRLRSTSSIQDTQVPCRVFTSGHLENLPPTLSWKLKEWENSFRPQRIRHSMLHAKAKIEERRDAQPALRSDGISTEEQIQQAKMTQQHSLHSAAIERYVNLHGAPIPHGSKEAEEAKGLREALASSRATKAWARLALGLMSMLRKHRWCRKAR